MQSPEDVRVWIASIVGGILSVVVVPIFINYITDKRKTEDELRKTLFEENKALYAKLSNILVELLVNESSIYKENTNSNIKAEKSLNVVNPLKDFLKDNYSELANTISISLIWDIVEVCQECSNSVTAYDIIFQRNPQTLDFIGFGGFSVTNLLLVQSNKFIVSFNSSSVLWV